MGFNIDTFYTMLYNIQDFNHGDVLVFNGYIDSKKEFVRMKRFSDEKEFTGPTSIFEKHKFQVGKRVYVNDTTVECIPEGNYVICKNVRGELFDIYGRLCIAKEKLPYVHYRNADINCVTLLDDEYENPKRVVSSGDYIICSINSNGFQSSMTPELYTYDEAVHQVEKLINSTQPDEKLVIMKVEAIAKKSIVEWE